ncbi:MAG TPA: VTT domain-containing protein [Chondromyces sp.]|nr:VTT domain-containing protein [Chondromyces sp.]
MGIEFTQWLPADPVVVLFISILLNIIIAVTAILPSAFITAANVAFFGFYNGMFVSIIGEAAGAVISFVLYRKGLNRLTSNRQTGNKFLLKLKRTSGMEAVVLVFLLRVLPFVPSGAVTLTAAYSQMGWLPFSIASTLGKIPSLLIEAYSVERVKDLSLGWQIGISIIIIGLIITYHFWKRKTGQIKKRQNV